MIGAGIEKPPEQPEKASACNPCPCCLRTAPCTHQADATHKHDRFLAGRRLPRAAGRVFELPGQPGRAGLLGRDHSGRTCRPHACTHAPAPDGSHTSTHVTAVHRTCSTCSCPLCTSRFSMRVLWVVGLLVYEQHGCKMSAWSAMLSYTRDVFA